MANDVDILRRVLADIVGNDFSALKDLKLITYINDWAMYLINNPNWTPEMVSIADAIFKISNIAYNNTSNAILPLDDGVYDQLLIIYAKYNPQYQVGSTKTRIQEAPENKEFGQKVMCGYTNIDRERYLYAGDIVGQYTPITQYVVPVMDTRDLPPISKRLIDTTHKYPELVGTLDKCKFVLNKDAINADVFDKPSVTVFERDFIHRCMDLGVITPNEKFTMVAELKYDGVSIEAEVIGDRIITALSRGDTGDNIATDLTPIFKNYRFRNAKDVPTDIAFGIKFEAVITNHNLSMLNYLRGKSYKNGRNAIIGITGASDAHKYAEFITLIPLATSLEMDRLTELKFLNKYYSSGEYNRYCVLDGDYMSILFKVKQFTESAESIRHALPYMIDGVVISFIDDDKIMKLGRINSVNKYSVAIKFNPRSARTIFLGYTYKVGKSGEIVPMANFKPCEFIGAIHTKQTIHSYARFKELALRIGDEIDVDYMNDVITYVTKPDTEHNRNNTEPEVPFVTNCPCCGTQIMISESGKSAKCPNYYCHERAIMRMKDMIDRLGFKDFSEESIRALDLTTFSALMSQTLESASILGPNSAAAFIAYINSIKSTPVNDFKLMSAFSFDSIADETWKVILKNYTIGELFYGNTDIYRDLTSINKIGPKTAEAVIKGFKLHKQDIEYCLANFSIINSKGAKEKPKIVFTGIRDKAFIDMLIEHGYDADERYGITKSSYCLIAADKNSNSSKIAKAQKFNIPIYTKAEFIEAHGIKL